MVKRRSPVNADSAFLQNKLTEVSAAVSVRSKDDEHYCNQMSDLGLSIMSHVLALRAYIAGAQTVTPHFDLARSASEICELAQGRLDELNAMKSRNKKE